jgi:hypothetical protein
MEAAEKQGGKRGRIWRFALTKLLHAQKKKDEEFALNFFSIAFQALLV